MRLKNIRSRPGGVSGQRGPGKGLRIQSPRLEGETRQRGFPGGRRGRVIRCWSHRGRAIAGLPSKAGQVVASPGPGWGRRKATDHTEGRHSGSEGAGERAGVGEMLPILRERWRSSGVF